MDIDEFAATKKLNIDIDAADLDKLRKTAHIVFLNGDGSPVPEDDRVGAFFTHYGVFNNVKVAHEAMGDNLVLLADGTNKLHDGGYVLIIVGSIHVYFAEDDKVVRNTFRPFGYALVPGENAKVKAI